jgi:hypothetical protein
MFASGERTGGRRVRSLGAVLVSVVLLLAIGGPVRAGALAAPRATASRTEPGKQLEPTNPQGCDTLDPSSCLLPWPSDFQTRPDAATDTGRRVDLNVLAMPTNAAGVPIRPDEQNRNDGFSPGQALITHVPGLTTTADLAASKLPPLTDLARYADADSGVVVLDAATLQRHPVFAELDVLVKDDADRHLLIRPAKSFEEGHRYIVGLRDLRTAAGAAIPPSPAFLTYRDATPATLTAPEYRRPHMDELFTDLAAAGVSRPSLYLAWDFTVASERSLSERMLHIRADAFSQLGDTDLADGVVQGHAPAFTVDTVTENVNDRILRQVQGTVTVPCYLQAPGCATVAGGTSFATADPLDPDALPVQQPGQTYAATYTCNIPRWVEGPDGPRPARGTLYGHGLFGGQGEVDQGQQQALDDDHGFVSCATDWIGMASNDIPNTGTVMADLSRFSNLADRVQQGMLNFLYLARAMAHADGFGSNAAFRVGGVPAIAPGVVEYDGNSQGGIIGGALAAFLVDGDHAVLGVPGMNYSTLLQRSSDFDTYALVLYNTYPDETTRQVVFGLIQMLWDRAEANGYAHHISDHPLPGTRPHEVMLHVAFGDHQVSNLTADIEARTAGMAVDPHPIEPGRSPDVTPVWGVSRIPSYPYAGSAIVYFDSGPPPQGTGVAPTTNTPPREGADPHERPRNTVCGRLMKDAFLRPGGLVTSPCGGAPFFSGSYRGADGLGVDESGLLPDGSPAVPELPTPALVIVLLVGALAAVVLISRQRSSRAVPGRSS